MNEITVEELQRRHDDGEDLVLLDVREPDELVTASIPWATHIPMREVPARIDEIPRERPVVVMCHHGGRSAYVTQFLEASGYGDVANLAGGIDDWAVSVDRTVPRY